jgi:hypothetical protein
MTPTTAADLATAVTAAARHELDEGMTKIEHCLAQLTDEQLWWRPRPEMNSIANLLLHLAGNLRQWIVAGVGGAPDTRDRPAEFADRSLAPRAHVVGILHEVIRECDAVLARVDAAQLVSPKRIQGFYMTAVGAIFHTVPHFRGHVQEIIHMTRAQVGEPYRFKFVPQGPEQTSTGGGSAAAASRK